MYDPAVCVWRSVPVMLLVSRVALADASEGGSCRVRAECRGELHCLDGTCRSTDASTTSSLVDGRVHPFIGATLTGGFVLAGVTGTSPSGFGSVNGAFRMAVDAWQLGATVGLGF